MPIDHYGLSIGIHRGMIECEDNLETEFYLVNRDKDNNVTGSVCIGEEAIESIEEDNDVYTIRFNFDMTDIDISEYKSLEQLRAEREEKQKA